MGVANRDRSDSVGRGSEVLLPHLPCSEMLVSISELDGFPSLQSILTGDRQTPRPSGRADGRFLHSETHRFATPNPSQGTPPSLRCRASLEYYGLVAGDTS